MYSMKMEIFSLDKDHPAECIPATFLSRKTKFQSRTALGFSAVYLCTYSTCHCLHTGAP